MMYRDWREVTKSLISPGSKNGVHSLSASSLPKSKMERPERKVYVKWVIGEMKKNFAQFDGYTKGHGIIKTRQRFLEWLQSGAGEKDLEEEARKEAETGTTTADGRVFGKSIIVPVAIPGCGKTAVSVALAHIFGFDHTQSDDVQVKKPAPVFIKNVIGLLNDHDVVIADKSVLLLLSLRCDSCQNLIGITISSNTANNYVTQYRNGLLPFALLLSTGLPQSTHNLNPIMTIIFYDIPSRPPGGAWSPNTWKTRYET